MLICFNISKSVSLCSDSIGVDLLEFSSVILPADCFFLKYGILSYITVNIINLNAILFTTCICFVNFNFFKLRLFFSLI